MKIIDTTTGTAYTYNGDRTELETAYDDDTVRDTLTRVLDHIDAGTPVTAEDLSYLAIDIQPDEEPDEAEALHQALATGVHAQREAYPPHPAYPAHTIDDVQIFVNPELKGGGLTKWRDNPNFWVRLVTPDGHTTVVDGSLGGWEFLLSEVREQNRAFRARVAQKTRQLEARVDELSEAERVLAEVREARDAAIRDLSAAGVSNYRLAQLCGVSQPTIARIIK